MTDNEQGMEVRIHVHPEPPPAVMAAIVAAVRRHRAVRAVDTAHSGPQPHASRWARAGRHEAISARETMGADMPRW